MVSDECEAGRLSFIIRIPHSSLLNVVGQVVTRLVLDEVAVFLSEWLYGFGRYARDQQVLPFEPPRDDRADADDAAGWYHASRRDANLRADVSKLADLDGSRALPVVRPKA